MSPTIDLKLRVVDAMRLKSLLFSSPLAQFSPLYRDSMTRVLKRLDQDLARYEKQDLARRKARAREKRAAKAGRKTQ